MKYPKSMEISLFGSVERYAEIIIQYIHVTNLFFTYYKKLNFSTYLFF